MQTKYTKQMLLLNLAKWKRSIFSIFLTEQYSQPLGRAIKPAQVRSWGGCVKSSEGGGKVKPNLKRFGGCQDKYWGNWCIHNPLKKISHPINSENTWTKTGMALVDTDTKQFHKFQLKCKLSWGASGYSSFPPPYCNNWGIWEAETTCQNINILLCVKWTMEW